MNWNQLGTILWLRWRLTRNQWLRGGQINAIITMIITVIGLFASVMGGFVGILVGTFAMSTTSPWVMLGIWDAIIGAFLFFWMLGIVAEIQRSETIDIGKMLHLPVSLRDIFIINYLTSHLTPVIIFFLPGMVGLCLGLTLGRNFFMILLLPLVLGFIFMTTAWTYCLRGWLIRLMVNKRRRRAIIAVMTFMIIILCQLPNIFTNVMSNNIHNKHHAIREFPSNGQTNPFSSDNNSAVAHTLLTAHKFVPFLWVAGGAMSLAKGNLWPAVLGAAGLFLIGGLGLRKAYRATIRFYQGQTTSKKSVYRPKKKKVPTPKRSLGDISIAGVPQEASAMAIVSFRCLIRLPKLKLRWQAILLCS